MTLLQIELYEGAGDGTSFSSEDQYDTALAYLAEGYCTRRPQHVRTAHRLLQALHNKLLAGSSSASLGACIFLPQLQPKSLSHPRLLQR